MDGDLVPPDASEKSVRDEVNRRTHRAGYTDRDGQPMLRREIVSRWSRKYSNNFQRAFGHE